MRTIVLLLAMFAIAAVLLGMITKVPEETMGHLLVGWWAFISRSFWRLTWNWYGVATALLSLALLLVGGHPFLRWLVGSIRSAQTDATNGPSDGSPTPARAVPVWTCKRTAQLLFVFMLLFAAGTAFIGLVHQTAWLATAPEPLTRYRLNVPDFYASPNNLKQMGASFDSFVYVYGRCPPNGPAPDMKQGSHSWQTRILPFTGMNHFVDLQRDWDDEKNAPAFRRFVMWFLNPDIGVLRESRGYAVSHYAGNSRLFAWPREMTRESLASGTSNSIVCGEVVTDFKAWGDPANVRDPVDGVNQTAAGFGSTNERGANFLMLDGSVRFLATKTDRDVLTALAGD